MPHHPVYGLDIETGYPKGQVPPATVEPTTGEQFAVDPRHSVVVRAVVSTAAGDATFEGPEADLLADLDALLAGLEPGILTTWNGAEFDLPYLADRAGARRVHLGLRLAVDPRRRFRGETLPGHRHTYRAAWYAHRHLDAARLYRSGRRPLVEVDELFRAIGWNLRGRSARAAGPADCPGAELTHDAVHAFASNDAKLVRSLVEARLPGAAKHLDRITVTGAPAASPPATTAAAPAPGRRALVGRISLSPAHPAVRAALTMPPR